MAQAKRKEREGATGDAEVKSSESKGLPDGVVPWAAPAPMARNALIAIGVVAFLVNLPIIHYYLLRPAPEATVGLPYQDDFSDPSTVLKHYWSSGGLWRVVDGQLV